MQEKKFVLVTGGMGYIGSHTTVELFQNGWHPILVDDLRNSKETALDGIEKITGIRPLHFNFACQDEIALNTVFENYPISGVIHFAADKAVGESVLDPLKYYSNNIESLLSLLRCMEKHNVFSFVFSSSCTVYGNANQEKINETYVNSEYTSPYGHTKMLCEQILESIANNKSGKNKNWQITLLRYFNPIGAHPSGNIGELPSGIPNNLVPYLMQVANGERSELSVFGNDYPTPDGSCIRDYIHVCDLANAHVLALEKQNNDASNLAVYNVGTGKGTSVLELISLFTDQLRVPLPFKIVARRLGDSVAVIADTSKIGRELSWKARFSVKDALEHAWTWEIKRNKK